MNGYVGSKDLETYNPNQILAFNICQVCTTIALLEIKITLEVVKAGLSGGKNSNISRVLQLKKICTKCSQRYPVVDEKAAAQIPAAEVVDSGLKLSKKKNWRGRERENAVTGGCK